MLVRDAPFHTHPVPPPSPDHISSSHRWWICFRWQHQVMDVPLLRAVLHMPERGTPEEPWERCITVSVPVLPVLVVTVPSCPTQHPEVAAVGWIQEPCSEARARLGTPAACRVPGERGSMQPPGPGHGCSPEQQPAWSLCISRELMSCRDWERGSCRD